jgi:outer membrane biosynthesis protein TonB
MADRGMRRAVASIRLCLNEDGEVADVTLLRGSGLDWDQKILDETRGWSYRPYAPDGEPRRVCTAVTFVFDLKPRE